MAENLLIQRDSYFTAAQEDRCAPRTRIAIPAALRVSGGRGFQTVVHDLSLSGFCSAAVNRVHPGTVCWLTLPGIEALQAEVVWWDSSLTGCAFDKLLSPIVLDNILSRWRAEAPFRPLA
jgi:PilZ domain